MTTKITLSAACAVISFEVVTVTPAIWTAIHEAREIMDDLGDGTIYVSTAVEHPEAEEDMGVITEAHAIQAIADFTA